MLMALSHFGSVLLDRFCLKAEHFHSTAFDACAVASHAEAFIAPDAAHEKMASVSVTSRAILTSASFLVVCYLMRLTWNAAFCATI